MSDEAGLKRSDQIALLVACREFTDTDKWPGLFTYPNCGCDLVQSGLATEDRKITTAGRAALWLLEKWDDDPTTSKTYVEFSIPIRR